MEMVGEYETPAQDKSVNFGVLMGNLFPGKRVTGNAIAYDLIDENGRPLIIVAPTLRTISFESGYEDSASQAQAELHGQIGEQYSLRELNLEALRRSCPEAELRRQEGRREEEKSLREFLLREFF